MEYQKQLSAASAYWLGKQENKAKIADEKLRIEWNCQVLVSKVSYEYFGTKLVGLSRAADFIEKFNHIIQGRLDKFFSDARRMDKGK